MQRLKLAVLISGSGTNLQAIIDACRKNLINAEIVLVLSNKADAYGLKRAEEAGIRTKVINHKNFENREAFDKAMDAAIENSEANFVCMAGFMRILSDFFVDKWYSKLINIHPSLLPSFKGVDAQAQALKAGVKVAGCTVHFVNNEMDAGPIIIQKATEVLPDDTTDTLTARILKLEHESYIEALKVITTNSYELKGKVVVVKR